MGEAEQMQGVSIRGPWKAVRQALGQALGRRGTTTRTGPDGFQEVNVVISGRYRPDRLVVQQGRPVRITFLRLEEDPCSEWVIFSAFGLEMPLPPFRKVTLSFIPDRPGEFLFTCRMGIYRGKLVVLPSRPKPASVERASGLGGKA